MEIRWFVAAVATCHSKVAESFACANFAAGIQSLVCRGESLYYKFNITCIGAGGFPSALCCLYFGRDNRLIEEDAFMRMVERELTDGEHIRPTDSAYHGIGRSHFHSAEELREELTAGGFSENAVHGVVGAAWLAPELDTLLTDPTAREALLRTARLLDRREDISGLSTHLLCISEK